MACEQVNPDEQLMQARIEALQKLEQMLGTGAVQVRLGEQGAIWFEGWKQQDRAGLADACTVQRLTLDGSMALREAIARAEQQSGRAVNWQVIGQGTHSHDGGKTWHGGH